MTLLTNIDGENHELPLPLDASEWHFGQFCDFRAYENRFHQVNARVESEALDSKIAERAMAEALEKVVGPIIHELPVGLPGDDIAALFNENYRITIGTELSQTRIYAHLASIAVACEANSEEVLEKYPLDTLPYCLKIELQGRQFKVLRDRTARVLSGQPLTTGEAIECHEYRRRYSEERPKIKGFEQPDRASALDYTLGLTEVAILLRRFGEQLPADDGARDRWLNRRRDLLRDIDLQTVQAIRFFPVAALLRFARGGNTNSSPKALRAER